MSTNSNQSKTVTLFGNLGKDPQLRQVAPKEVTMDVYDPIVDDVVERTFMTEPREFLTYSIAVQSKEMREQGLEAAWIYCVDWESLGKTYRKGDRIRVRGHFEERTYTDTKTGEDKTIKQFVVAETKLEKMKVHDRDAA